MTKKTGKWLKKWAMTKKNWAMTQKTGQWLKQVGNDSKDLAMTQKSGQWLTKSGQWPRKTWECTRIGLMRNSSSINA